MDTIINYSVFSLYILSTLSIWWVMLPGRKRSFFTFSTWFFWLIAIFGHFYILYPVFSNNSINLSLEYALLIVAFIISVTLYFSSIFSNTKFLGLIILPLVSLVFLFDFVKNPVNITINNFLFIHIVISLISYSILCLSAAQSLILKLQEKKLQTNQPIGLIAELPSLDAMDKLLFKILALGVIFLSASLASGFIFLDDIFAQNLAHKTILSILAWIIFVFLIYARKSYGWRGTKAANINLIGFFILFLSYFGTKTVLEIIL